MEYCADNRRQESAWNVVPIIQGSRLKERYEIFMDSIKTGNLIYKNRKEKKMTQLELGNKLGVSDKTISKWERGMGCPDIALMSSLAEILGVNVTELLSGEANLNDNDSGNMKKTKFYLCQSCGNIITSTNDLIISCCGKKLKQLTVCKDADPSHMPEVSIIEDDLYIRVDHQMEKKHYITLIAFVTDDKLQMHKLYPEQNAEIRFHRIGHGILYVLCSQHGLWMKRI